LASTPHPYDLAHVRRDFRQDGIDFVAPRSFWAGYASMRPRRLSRFDGGSRWSEMLFKDASSPARQERSERGSQARGT